MDTELQRPRWRGTANYRLLPRLSAGIEYNPAAGEVAPLATFIVARESNIRPLLFLGTSSDRIGSPRGAQAGYLTAAKNFDAVPVSPYMSLHYSGWKHEILIPFGAYIHVGAGISLQPMYDGHNGHLLGTFATTRWSATLLYAWMERFGAAVAVGF